MPYTEDEIKLINQTTTNFYSEVGESFSATRQHEWDGWKKCLRYINDGDSVLDLGCGNRRFSKFLEENLTPNNGRTQTASLCQVDSYDNFAWDEKVKEVDIVDSLLNDSLNLKSYDVAVCFGVMHHIPSAELRLRLLQELSKSKIAIVSFWQFKKDVRIFTKAQETTKLVQEKLGLQKLEENDYFLGWQDKQDVFRFCHNFTNAEIEYFASKFKIIDKFIADKLNKYIIFSSGNSIQ